jgi:excisionase family DNA binding protein
MIEDPNVLHPARPVPITVRVCEACRLTGIGRSKFYELISAGEIEVIKVGAITLIPMDALESFVDARRKRG